MVFFLIEYTKRFQKVLWKKGQQKWQIIGIKKWKILNGIVYIMWQLDHKEAWAPENWCFWIVLLEKTLGSPLGSKEIKLTNPKGNQPWLFIGRADAEAEAPILWPPDTKSQPIRKDPDFGKDWRQEKGMTEDDLVGWHHRHCQWTWVWVNSGSWWRIGRPGVLQFMGSQRVGRDQVTELNCTDFTRKE